MKNKQPSLSVEKLLDFVIENKESLKESGILISKHEINYYGHNYSEYGEYFELTLLMRKFHIGYNFITEDSDDWAQAEGYQTHILHEVVEENKEIEIETNKLHHLLVNYKSIKRNEQINKLIN